MPEEMQQAVDSDVTIALTDVETDIRSSTRLFQLTITNNSKLPLLLHAITHGHSEKATITTYTHDIFHIRLEKRYARIKRHLSYLLDYIDCCLSHVQDHETPPGHASRWITKALLYIKHYLIRRPHWMTMPCALVTDGESASAALSFFRDQSAMVALANPCVYDMSVIEHEACDMKAIENILGMELYADDIIPPGRNYIQTISAKYKRGAFNSRQELLEATCHYIALDDDRMKSYANGGAKIEKHTFDGVRLSSLRAEACTVISPWPFILSGIAMLFGVIGLALKNKTATTISSLFAADQPTYVTNTAMAFPQIATPLLSVLLALIFFNVYEYTTYRTKLTLRLNWRSAMVIGTLCGLGGDKILKVIETIIQ